MENPNLTKRELQVLKLIVLPRKEIAERLVVSKATIETHESNIFAKLGTHSRAETVLTAIRQGIIGIEDFIYDE